MRLGELEIVPIRDGLGRVPARDILTPPDGDEAAWECHAEHFTADGTWEMSLGGFLIRTADRVVLVDVGLGPIRFRGFGGGEFLDSLARAGVRPDDVTDVLLTHLHMDHIGWVSRHGSPVFPRATYRCHAADWACFVDSPTPDRQIAPLLTPVAGRLEPFDTDATLAPGVDAQHTPGHTPGSTVFVISSGLHRALLLGDAAHSPVELLDDGWIAAFDADLSGAQAARARLAAAIEADGTQVASPHFSGMRFGRIVTGTTRREWVYIDH